MTSAWEIDTQLEFDPLGKDTEADVCVIGGGLAGVWCSYLLAKEGKKVVLIEKDKLGRAATLYTTAFITEVVDTPFEELEKMFDRRTSDLVRRSGREAIDRIESVVGSESIDCEFMRAPLAIYDDLKDLSRPKEVVENQAKYHPVKFFAGLVKAAEKGGVKFFEKTEAREVEGDTVITKSGKHIRAKDIVVATYQPFNNPRPTKLMKGMYVSYVYGLELPKGELKEGMYIDQENPYHYVRVDDLDTRMRMIVGGEDHRAELAFLEHKSFEALKTYIKQTFPNLSYTIRERWSGEILEPTDGLPLIGAYGDHRYVATAFSGNGMTYSAIAGRLITDLIMGRRSEYQDVYHPCRELKAKALLYKFRDYSEEFWNGAVKKMFS